MSRVCAAAMLPIFVFFASPAAALTADDVRKMSKDERYGYLTGLIDMLSFHAARDGRTDRVKCIIDRYYSDRSRRTKAWEQIYDTLDRFRDKEPTTLVAFLVEKACGK